MNLREYLRNEFSMYIRSRLVKGECEWCGETKDLHFHHIDRFHNLLNDTLEELNLNELNTEEYSSNELNLISSLMLAKQIKNEYKTLCKKCHFKIHSMERNSDEYRDNYKNPFGEFIYFDYKLFYKYDEAYVFRFLKLCCHINYANDILYGKQKCKNISDIYQLKEILSLSDGQFYPTVKYLFDNNFLKFCNDSLIVNSDVCCMGSKSNKLKHSVRIYKKTFINLYKSCTTKSHKRYANLFKLIDTLNVKYNLITSSVSERCLENINNDFCKISDFEKIIGGRSVTSNSLNLFLNTTLIDDFKLLKKININCKNYYIINPNLIYNGALNNDILYCYNLICFDNIGKPDK